MAKIQIKIEGTEETIRELNTFEREKSDKARVIVRKYAGKVRRKAKQLVPVSPAERKKTYGKPGDLKASIRAKYYYEGLGAMVFPDGKKGWYRGIVEAGTRTRHTRRTKAYRGRQKAQPFMEPAKQEHERAYNSEMENLFDGDTTI